MSFGVQSGDELSELMFLDRFVPGTLSHEGVAWWSMSGTLENGASPIPKCSCYFERNSRWTLEIWNGLRVVLNIASVRRVHASLCCKQKAQKIAQCALKRCCTRGKKQKSRKSSLVENPPPPTSVFHWILGFKERESSIDYVELGTIPKVKRVERVATEGMIHLTPSVSVVACFFLKQCFCDQQWTCNDSRQSF